MTAFILLYIYLLSANSLKLFSPDLDAYPCLGKMSSFSRNGFLLLSGNTPPKKEITPKVQQGTEPAASVVVPTRRPLAAFRLAVFECGDFSALLTVSAPFSLTPGISFCADTYPRSNLHETILLRLAF